MKFNKSQASAISHRDGAMLVLAGPGSGKTAVITQRTKTLITEYDVNPSNIPSLLRFHLLCVHK